MLRIKCRGMIIGTLITSIMGRVSFMVPILVINSEKQIKSIAQIMTFTALSIKIFDESTLAYHKTDNIDSNIPNPYETGSIEYSLFMKNWIDVVQWHLEDIIRNPEIDAIEALAIKRRIDKSNQDRTDLVEKIDEYFLKKFEKVGILPDAVINTESPAWALDRLSILVLKIWHMQAEVNRTDATREHIDKCCDKLGILLEQKKDLSLSITQLIEDIGSGRRYMKVYRQMKMYNDPSLNPALYKSE